MDRTATGIAIKHAGKGGLEEGPLPSQKYRQRKRKEESENRFQNNGVRKPKSLFGKCQRTAQGKGNRKNSFTKRIVHKARKTKEGERQLLKKRKATIPSPGKIDPV